MAPWAISVFRRAVPAASFSFMPSFYLDFTMTGSTGGTLQYSSYPADRCGSCARGMISVSIRNRVLAATGLISILPTGAPRRTSRRPPRASPKCFQLQPAGVVDRANAATGGAARNRLRGTGRATHRAGSGVDGGYPRCGTGAAASIAPIRHWRLSESTATALNVNAIKELNALIVALTDRIAAAHERRCLMSDTPRQPC